MNPIKTNTLLTIAVALCYFSGIASADCGGIMTRQPVRNIINRQPVRTAVRTVAQVQPVRNVLSAKPVRTFLQKIRTQTSSCSGDTVQSFDCASYETNQAVSVSCSPSRTTLITNEVANVPQPTFGLDNSDAYARAYASASAQARAGRMQHFVSLEMPRVKQPGQRYESGVGFSTSDSTPMTCLGEPGNTNATCAVVRGDNGWYAACVRP